MENQGKKYELTAADKITTTPFFITEEDEKLVQKARDAYDNSKTYVDKLFLNMWNYALKMYYLCGVDRQRKLTLKNKANVMAGLTAESVDIMASYLVDNPLRFKATALGDTPVEKAEGAQDVLFFCSDRTKFQSTLRNGLIKGLIVGSVPLKTAYVTESDVTTTVMRGGLPKQIVKKGYSGPATYFVDPFNVFPDFYPTDSYDGRKRLRSCTERGVCDASTFETMFSQLIESSDNRSPLKNKELRALCETSECGTVSRGDFGWTRMSILEFFNNKCKDMDGFSSNGNKEESQLTTTPGAYGNMGKDSELTKGLGEWRMTEWNDEIVLLRNGFPVYIGKNSKRFISINIIPFKDVGMPFGMPLAISLMGPELVATSFQSTFVDNAAASINKANLINKNLILNTSQVDSGVEPGQNIIVDGATNGQDLRNAMQPLERGRPEEYGVVDSMRALAQRLTGVSEYNSGVASRERVATAVSALVESLLRRLGPYLKNAADVVSIVAEQWIELIRTNWDSTTTGYVRDANGKQVPKDFNPQDLDGSFQFTLETEGMVNVNNEMALKKLTDVYNVLVPGGMTNASEFAKHILRRAGLPGSLVVVEGMTLPANASALSRANLSEPGRPVEGVANPELQDVANEMGQAVNPQIGY
jgi:hypothetical protein